MERYKHLWINKQTGKLGTQESDFVESVKEAISQYWQEFCPSIYDYQYTLVLKDDGSFGTLDIEEVMEETPLDTRTDSQMQWDRDASRADNEWMERA